MRDDENHPELQSLLVEPTESESFSSDPKPPPRTASFVFTGNASKYFRIWIVNVRLSLVTLGIYSAWAKVRTKRYVRGHTLLDGVPFTYDARPIAILRGRLIAALLLGLWVALAFVSPIAQLLALLPILFIVPSLVMVSLRFSAPIPQPLHV